MRKFLYILLFIFLAVPAYLLLSDKREDLGVYLFNPFTQKLDRTVEGESFTFISATSTGTLVVGNGISTTTITGGNVTTTEICLTGDSCITEWATGGSATTTWGTITGTLSDQTDLQLALDDKYDVSNPAGYITTTPAETDPVWTSVSSSYFLLSDWNATTTDALDEGSTNLYYTDARARNALSSTATGLSYSTSTGVFSMTAGYTIPLTASTTDWQTAYEWGDHAGGGYLVAGNNLSDLTNSSTARTNLGLGGLAVQNASSVVITGGTIDGVTIGASTPGTGVFTAVTSTDLVYSGSLTTPFTQGSLLFAGSGGVVSQNNANLFWDNSGARLAIGTSTFPATNPKLQVQGGAEVDNRIILGRGITSAGQQTILGIWAFGGERPALAKNNTTGKIVYQAGGGTQGLEMITEARSITMQAGGGLTLASSDITSYGTALLDLQTIFNGTGTYQAHRIRLTDTASNANSAFAHYYLGTDSKFIVRKDGFVGINTSTLDSALTFNTSSTISGGISFGGDAHIYRTGVGTLSISTSTIAQLTVSGGLSVASLSDLTSIDATSTATLSDALGARSITRIVTSSMTWTKPASTSFARVQVWCVGGGGGGGGSGTNSTIGGGGGGGGASYKIIDASAITATTSVTVGSAGTAGASGNNAGGSGGTSSFGSHITCTGGGGGNAGSGSSGGSAGTATGGDYNGNGIGGQSAGTYTDSYRGYGGSAGVNQGHPEPEAQDAVSRIIPAGGILGIYAGAGAPRPPSWDANNRAGGVGTSFGAGGSGGQRVSANVAGGVGRQGVVVIVEEYE